MRLARPITIVALCVLIVGGVAIFARHQGSGGPAPLPVTIGAAAASTAMAPASTIAGPTHYVAAADLAELDGSAHAARVAASEPSDAQMTRLASALGVDGRPVRAGEGWIVGGAGGATLRVTPAAGGPWRWQVDAAAEPVVPTCAVTASPVHPPAEPTPTVTFACGTTPAAGPGPSAPTSASAPAELEARARSVLTRGGYDLTGWSLESRGTTVSVSPRVDGHPVVGLDVELSFGPAGVVVWGIGTWGTPELGDSYPLIGTRAAIAALDRGDGTLAPVPLAMTAGPAVGVTEATPPVTGTVPPTTGTVPPHPTPAPCGACPTLPGVACAMFCRGSAGSDPSSPHPAGPTETSETTETTETTGTTDTTPGPDPAGETTVTIVAAEVVTVAEPGTDGATWLVPAYRLSSAQGGSWLVLAIARSDIAPPGTAPGSHDDGSTGATSMTTVTTSMPPSTVPATTVPASSVPTTSTTLRYQL